MKDHQMESFVIATQPSGNSSGGMDLATLQPPPPHQVGSLPLPDVKKYFCDDALDSYFRVAVNYLTLEFLS